MERLNRIVEHFSPLAWLGLGSLMSIGSGLAVIPLVGTAEIIAAVLSFFAGAGALSAAGWANHLQGLPLMLAPVLAEWEGPAGRQLTMRAWLGRGRRLDDVVVEVEAEGRALQVLAPGVPVLGCFQAVFPAVDAPITVRIKARAGKQQMQAERIFGLDARVLGRFQPGFSSSRGQWDWHQERWNEVTARCLKAAKSGSMS